VVRTLAEVNADRVRVTIELLDGAPSERLYTAAEVGDAQAGEAELVAKPLQRRIAELEKLLEESRALVAHRDKALDQATDDLAALVSQRRDRDRLLEISKKNEATALAQVAVAGHRTESAETALHEAQHEMHKLARNLGRVAGQVYSPALVTVLAKDWKSWTESETSLILFAISAVRNIVGGPPTPPTKSETQA